MSNQIKTLFSEIHNVPQISEVIRRLICQLNDPDIDLKEVARNVEKEQVISAKVLRLVNSASFALPKKIASIEEAVISLGMIKLKTLVIASGIVSSVPKIENFDINQFWLDSFSTATYARWISNASGTNADIAFTAGLLNGIGTVLIHLGQPKKSLEIQHLVLTGEHSRFFIEKKKLGFTSQDVSAELCQFWKFSEELTLPISQCGDPLNFDPISKMACCIYIARQLSISNANQITTEETLALIPLKMIEILGLSHTFFNERIEDILSLESGLEGLLE